MGDMTQPTVSEHWRN